MKFLFDLFPLILFFAAFKFADIFVATAVAIAATFIQIGWTWFRQHKIETMLWVNLVIITFFGGLTLLFHDETFIKWKPTVLYWAFAIVLAGSVLILQKNLIKTLMSKQIQLPEKVWQQLNWSWVVFFVFMGAANLAIAFGLGLSTNTWVKFKVFGGIGLMLVFVIIQGIFLSRYLEENEDKK